MPRKKKSEMTIADEINLEPPQEEKENLNEETVEETAAQEESENPEEVNEEVHDGDGNADVGSDEEVEDDSTDLEKSIAEELSSDPSEEIDVDAEGDKLANKMGFRERIRRKNERINKLAARVKELESGDIVEQEIATIVGPCPSRTEYDDDDTYFKARMQYENAKNSLRDQHMQREKKIAEEASRAEEMLARGENKYEDFNEVVAPLLDKSFPYNEGVQAALLDSVQGPELVYILGQNLDAARKISSLPPVKAIKEINKLELRLSARKKARRSQAPPPPQKLQRGTPSTKNIGKMSQGEFEAYYKNNIEKSGGF